MKKVLVTGGNGQLARCLNDVANPLTKYEFIFAGSTDLDITNTNQVNIFFDQNSFNYCINCAAYTAVDKAEEESERAFKINATGAENLAKACLVNEVTLIHISTDFVFDGEQVCSYEERDTTNPINVYGASKLKGEQLIQENLSQYFILRTSWLYSEYGSNFLKTMLRLGNERDQLNVVSDQIGSPTYAKDLARAILKIIEIDSKDYGIYHYANSGNTSWYGFAKAIFEESSVQIALNEIKSEEYLTPAKRPYYSVLSKKKIIEKLDLNIPYWKDSLKVAIKTLNKD
ncbi:MAG: dTDP-4-dehydrorhamnose reductase [Urechidicola sp.]|nr:dTDP-4-dehydrorhamnose reductase [Urechidicola sp.]